MFKEGTLTFRQYVRVLGVNCDNVRPFVHVEAEDLAYVLAQIDDMRVMHSRIFEDGQTVV